jgi:signal transduction histidine kinase
MIALWITVGVLALAVVVLSLKIYFMKKAAREIAQCFADCLAEDTNVLITVSTGDKAMRALAEAINRELRRLRRQQLQYLNGDSELKGAVTNISHDLRTPLTAICGYLELLQKEEKSPNVARYLEVIAGRAEVMKHLAEELFRYSVILSAEEKLTLKDLDLRGALEESLAAFYGALTARGITPQITMTEHPVVRRLDQRALSRVLENILNNVLKYSDGDLAVTLTDGGDLIFANSAASLSEVQVGKLFDRFFSVEAARNSTGLGLSIAKSLVESMGGSIGADYRDGMLFIRMKFE